MTLVPPSSHSLTPAQATTQIRAQLTAQGLLSQSGDEGTYATPDAPPTQNVFGRGLGLIAGDVVTGIALTNSTPAAGTLPTLARAGIADSAGVMLARSGNVSALAIWDGGFVLMPLAAPYTITATGGYYAVYVVDGVWGTTPPTPRRQTANNYAGLARPGYMADAFVWGGQTDLPANGQPLTTSGGGRVYWTAFY